LINFVDRSQRANHYARLPARGQLSWYLSSLQVWYGDIWHIDQTCLWCLVWLHYADDYAVTRLRDTVVNSLPVGTTVYDFYWPFTVITMSLHSIFVK